MLEDLVTKVSDGMMTCYEEIVALSRKKKSPNFVPLSQQLALQLMYDVKFILSIMPRKEDLPVSYSLLHLLYNVLSD